MTNTRSEKEPQTEREFKLRSEAESGESHQNHEVCIIDIETTGIIPSRDAIIEIGVIRIETQDGVFQQSVFNELVRPSGNIPKKIRDMTGITKRNRTERR